MFFGSLPGKSHLRRLPGFFRSGPAFADSFGVGRLALGLRFLARPSDSPLPEEPGASTAHTEPFARARGGEPGAHSPTILLRDAPPVSPRTNYTTCSSILSPARTPLPQLQRSLPSPSSSINAPIQLRAYRAMCFCLSSFHSRIRIKH